MLESTAAEVVNRTRAFSDRVRIWILKNCRASIGSDAGAKSRFSMSDRVFAIAGIKLREHLNCRIYRIITSV